MSGRHEEGEPGRGLIRTEAGALVVEGVDGVALLLAPSQDAPASREVGQRLLEALGGPPPTPAPASEAVQALAVAAGTAGGRASAGRDGLGALAPLPHGADSADGGAEGADGADGGAAGLAGALDSVEPPGTGASGTGGTGGAAAQVREGGREGAQEPGSAARSATTVTWIDPDDLPALKDWWLSGAGAGTEDLPGSRDSRDLQDEAGEDGENQGAGLRARDTTPHAASGSGGLAGAEALGRVPGASGAAEEDRGTGEDAGNDAEEDEDARPRRRGARRAGSPVEGSAARPAASPARGAGSPVSPAGGRAEQHGDDGVGGSAGDRVLVDTEKSTLAPDAPEVPDAPEAPEGGPGSPAALGAAPFVLASLCSAGHANPPDLTQCVRCGLDLPGRLREVRRPVLVVLRLSDGRRVPVAGDVVVGRAPWAPTGSDPAAVTLVPVRSPARLVSRCHLAVTTAGWSVLACDLGSSNGTVLIRAERSPMLLEADVSVPLLVGDVLDVGDGVTLRVDPPWRLSTGS